MVDQPSVIKNEVFYMRIFLVKTYNSSLYMKMYITLLINHWTLYVFESHRFLCVPPIDILLSFDDRR